MSGRNSNKGGGGSWVRWARSKEFQLGAADFLAGEPLPRFVRDRLKAKRGMKSDDWAEKAYEHGRCFAAATRRYPTRTGTNLPQSEIRVLRETYGFAQ